MDDLISRQAAIDVLDEQIEQCNKSLSSFDISMKDAFAVKVEKASLVAFREILKFLPPAQQEQRWISVTERLPKEDDYRPCYDGYEDGAVWWRNDRGVMGLGWYYPSTGKWAYYDKLDGCDKGVGNVVEWMPLPKQ